MNRGELRTHVGYIINRGDEHEDLVNDAINLALKEISTRHGFRDMKSQSDLAIVADDASVALPSLTHHVIEARLIDSTSSYEIDLRPKRQLTNLYPNISADSTGKPEYAYVEADTLYLFPLSDDSYTVRVTVSKLMADLASDASEPEVVGLDRVIIAWVASWVYEAVDMPEQANRWFARFEQQLDRAIDDDERRVAENLIMTPFQVGTLRFPSNYYNDPFFKWPGGF